MVRRRRLRRLNSPPRPSSTIKPHYRSSEFSRALIGAAVLEREATLLSPLGRRKQGPASPRERREDERERAEDGEKEIRVRLTPILIDILSPLAYLRV